MSRPSTARRNGNNVRAEVQKMVIFTDFVSIETETLLIQRCYTGIFSLLRGTECIY